MFHFLKRSTFNIQHSTSKAKLPDAFVPRFPEIYFDAMNPKTPPRREESTDLLAQLAAAEAELESLSNSQLSSAVSTVNHAMLLRQSQEMIREAEERFRNLVELSPLGIFIQCEGKFTFVNDAT